MATETKKTTAGAVPALTALGSEAEQQKFAEVQRLQQELKDALDYRKGFYLDPTMLALAQGFAAPTRTGSFFESLGTVAGQLGQVQEAEAKRAREIAQMRLELAMGELGLQQQQRMSQEAEKFGRGELPGMVGAAMPTTTGTTGAAPTPGAQPAATPGAQPTGPRIYSQAEIDLQRLRNPIIADMMERQRKAALDAMKVSEKGVTTLTPGEGPGFKFEPLPGQPTVPRFEPGVGNLDFTATDAYAFDKAKETLSKQPDNAEAQAEINRLIKKVRGVSEKKEGPKTPSEAAIQSEVDKARALDQVKSENERFNAAMNKAAGAPVRMAQLDSMRDIAAGPNAKKYLGVFEGPKLTDALLKLGEGAGLPEIREIFINLGLDKDVKAEQLAFQQRMALVNLEMRKITRTPGEGAMSDFESRLALAAGLDKNDTPAGMVKKIDFLRAKEKFDLDFVRAMRNSKMTYDEFVLNNPQYTTLVNNYYKELSRIVGTDAVSSAATGAPASAAGAPSPLRQRLGLPPR